ncbi:MAG: hypothetical protein K8R21_06255 [Leptospira sp.]|nr:hypothetical protein [Leptospira sp.]
MFVLLYMRLFIFILLFSVSTGDLLADLIRLKNGNTEEGFVFSDEGQFIIIEKNGKKIKILKSEIEKVDLSYTGVPACYRLKKNSSQQMCDVILHSFESNKVKLADGKSHLTLVELDLDDLDSIEIKKQYREDISDFLPKGLVLNLILKKAPVKGKIKSIENRRLLIELADGKELLISEPDLVGFEYRESENIIRSGKTAFEFKFLVPGLAQYHRGSKIKGTVLFAMFGIMSIGASYEYEMARKSLAEKQIILLGDTVFYGTNINNNNDFIEHRRNVVRLTSMVAALYLYHLFDLYTYKKPGEISSPVVSIGFDRFSVLNSTYALRQTNIEFALTCFF